MQVYILSFCCIGTIYLTHIDASNKHLATPDISSKELGECGACKMLVNSFTNNYNPSRSKTANEFALIKSQICTESGVYQAQCLKWANKMDAFLYEWWAGASNIDLFEFLCYQKLKTCCPPLHYGKDCLPCNTDLKNVCNNNGKCKGEGTRKGNGNCACNSGYEGAQCDKCQKGFFEKFRSGMTVECEECHRACDDGCTGEGKFKCNKCKQGWKQTKALGCVDINECFTPNICSKNEFCVNTMGSFMCLKCDPSCVGCDGDGPDNCKACANDYTKIKGFCVNENQSVEDILSSTRHYTYFGLAVASIILLTRSRFVGSIIGIVVVTYISISEYYCMISGHSHGIFDLKDFDLFQMLKSFKA